MSPERGQQRGGEYRRDHADVLILKRQVRGSPPYILLPTWRFWDTGTRFVAAPFRQDHASTPPPPPHRQRVINSADSVAGAAHPMVCIMALGRGRHYAAKMISETPLPTAARGDLPRPSTKKHVSDHGDDGHEGGEQAWSRHSTAPPSTLLSSRERDAVGPEGGPGSPYVARVLV